MFTLHRSIERKLERSDGKEEDKKNPTHYQQLLRKAYLWEKTVSESVGSSASRVNHVSLREGRCLFNTESLATPSKIGVKWKSSSCVGMYGARLSKSRSYMS